MQPHQARRVAGWCGVSSSLLKERRAAHSRAYKWVFFFVVGIEKGGKPSLYTDGRLEKPPPGWDSTPGCLGGKKWVGCYY